MREKLAADTLMEVLEIPREDILEISFAGRAHQYQLLCAAPGWPATYCGSRDG